jgi:hypothetical protein
MRSAWITRSGLAVKSWWSFTSSLNEITAVSPASAANNCVKRMPLPPSLSTTAPEFELVWTATTRSMGYIIQSMCIACGTLLS